MTGQKMVKQDSYSTVIVLASGTRRTIKVTVTEGYSTKADISKIVSNVYPGATVECFGLYSSTTVPAL